MDIVELDRDGGAVDPATAPPLHHVLADRVRALSTPQRAALICIGAAVALVMVASITPWAIDYPKPLLPGLDEGSAIPVGIHSADPIGQFAYYAMWLIIVGCGLAAVFDQRRRSAWLGAGAGAVAGQILLLLPILRAPRILATATPPAATQWIGRSPHAAGTYVLVAALTVVTIALILAADLSRIHRLRLTTPALLLATFVIAAEGGSLPWIRVRSVGMVAYLHEVGSGSGFGLLDVFGPTQAAYHMIWMVFFVCAGALVCSQRPRLLLAGAGAGALAVQTLLVVGVLRASQSLYSSALHPFPRSAISVRPGVFVALGAVVVGVVALVSAVGEPRRLRTLRHSPPQIGTVRLGPVLVAVGFVLAVAAQTVAWVTSSAHGSLFGDAAMTISTWNAPTTCFYYLAWLIALGSAGALLLSRGPARRPLFGLTIGGLVAVLLIAVPFVLRPDTPEFQVQAAAQITNRRFEAGSFLLVAAIVAIGIGAAISALSGPRAHRARSARRLPIELAAVGMLLAVAAQTVHWFRLRQSYIGLSGQSAERLQITSPIWASASPLRYLAVMVGAWTVLFAAVGSAVVSVGPRRRRLVRVAAVALAIETVVTGLFLSHPTIPLPPVTASTQLAKPSPITEHPAYAFGAYVVVAALIAFAACLIVLSRREHPAPATALNAAPDTTPDAVPDTTTDDAPDETAYNGVVDLAAYMRPAGG